MRVGVGVGVGSALVPLSGSGSVLSPSAPCSHNPTIIRTTPRTATMAPTHLPQLTIRPHGAVGAPTTITITPVEWRALTGGGLRDRCARRSSALASYTASAAAAYGCHGSTAAVRTTSRTSAFAI